MAGAATAGPSTANTRGTMPEHRTMARAAWPQLCIAATPSSTSEPDDAIDATSGTRFSSAIWAATASDSPSDEVSAVWPSRGSIDIATTGRSSIAPNPTRTAPLVPERNGRRSGLTASAAIAVNSSTLARDRCPNPRSAGPLGPNPRSEGPLGPNPRSKGRSATPGRLVRSVPAAPTGRPRGSRAGGRRRWGSRPASSHERPEPARQERCGDRWPGRPCAG